MKIYLKKNNSLSDIVRFGKYKDKSWKHLFDDHSYVKWCIENNVKMVLDKVAFVQELNEESKRILSCKIGNYEICFNRINEKIIVPFNTNYCISVEKNIPCGKLLLFPEIVQCNNISNNYNSREEREFDGRDLSKDYYAPRY